MTTSKPARLNPAVVAIPLAALHPAPWNPRTISDERFRNLCASIQADPDFLWRRPVLAQADGTIYAGNMRYRAAQQLGLETIPAVVEDVSDQLARERALRDNRQWREDEEDDLAARLAQLREQGSDIDLLGRDEQELQQLLHRFDRIDALTDPDAVPDEPAEIYVQRGDVYLLGGHRLACGDATNADDVARLLNGERPLLTVSDSPYGVLYDPTWRAGTRRKGKVTNDDRADWSEVWALSPSDVIYAWHGGLHAAVAERSIVAAGFEVRAQIIWVKQSLVMGRGSYHWQHEPCFFAVRQGATAHWIGDRKQSTVWEIDNLRAAGTAEDAVTDHGTQKPVECMERAIRNHEGDVYDPFCGSGTCLVAAHRQGRRAFCMDVEPKYVQMALERWQNYSGQQAVKESSR